MPYRQAGEGPTPERERDVVRYGPFARTLRGLAVAPVFVVIVAAAVLWGGRGATLRCERARDRCELTTEYLFIGASSTRFSVSALRGARYRSNRSNSRVTLRVAGHSDLRLDNGSRATRDAIEAFASDSSRQRLEVSSWPSLFILLLLLPMMLGVVAALLIITLRQTRMIELAFVSDKAMSLTRRATFGTRSRMVSLEDVEKLRVAHGQHASSFLPGPKRAAATVSLVTRDGRERPLSMAPLPGGDVHDDIAVALAERLDCPIETTGR